MSDKETVILFGAGKLGKSVLPYIRESYSIIRWVDNSKDTWGDKYDGLTISSPDGIKGFNGKIIIATSADFIEEIAVQLKGLDVSEEHIFWARNNRNEFLIPYNAEYLEPDSRSLTEYDLMGRTETSSGFKAMLFCTSFSSYVIQLVNNVKKRYPEVEISIITRSNEYKKELPNLVSHLYIFELYSDLKTILGKLPYYDAFHLLWMENEWVYFRRDIKRGANRWIQNIGGSDFYRAAKKLLMNYSSHIIRMADIINVQSVNVKSDFLNVFPEAEDKTRITNYGLEVIDYISEEEKRNKNEILKSLHLPEDKIIITCGHNGNAEHQHIDMLDAISALDNYTKDRLCCVIPMTYPKGIDDYIRRVDGYLNKSGLNYRILTEYMNFQDMADYASISDIMIHVQTTDQLSSTMLEEMYAGSVVIAGSWLPYKWLREKGIRFWTVDRISDITGVLKRIISEFDKYHMECLCNRKIVYDIASWDNLADKWVELWKGK